MRGWLLVAGLVVITAAAVAQRPEVEPVLLLKVAAQDRSVFLQWNDLSHSGRYRIQWRRSGAVDWEGIRSTGSTPRGAIVNLDNGVWYDFQVVKESGGTPFVASEIVRQQPRYREPFGMFTTGMVFGSEVHMKSWMDSVGLEAAELACRGHVVVEWGPDVPDCAWSTPFGPALLLRAADSVYSPPRSSPRPWVIRQVAREIIWPRANPFDDPGQFPATVAKMARPDTGLVRQFQSAASYLFSTRARLSSQVTLFVPRSSIPGRVAIYIEGHGSFDQRAVVLGASTIDWLLGRGWTVVSMDMPLMGANAHQIQFGLATHDDLQAVYDGAISPLSEFMLPVKAVVDWVLSSRGGTADLLLVGRSGGGWTTYTYAAMDPRVTAVASAAGGLPMSLRLRETTPGDYEQTAPHFFGVVSHTDLMITAGRRGGFYHFASRDKCCFRVRPGEAFIGVLERIGASFGKRIDVFVDPISVDHGFSPASYQELDRFLVRVFGAGGSPP